jgi:hypothetical protein
MAFQATGRQRFHLTREIGGYTYDLPGAIRRMMARFFFPVGFLPGKAIFGLLEGLQAEGFD